MKIFLGFALIAAFVVLGYYICKTYRKDHRLTKKVGRVLIVGFWIVGFNILMLFTTSEKVCLFAYSMYFLAADWLLYFLFQFSVEYIGENFERYVKKKWMISLLAADCVSLLLNNVFGHLFRVQEVVLFGNEMYFKVKTTAFFYIHLGIILMLSAFCLISLLYQALKAPTFYRKKYVVIAIIMIAIILVNLFTFYMAIDISVIGYALEGICIYYWSFVYTPQRLLPKTLFMVAESMNVGLILMDLEGKRIYNNKYADGMLDEEQPLIGEDGINLEDWCHKKCLELTKETEEELVFSKLGKDVYLEIEMQRLIDGSGKFQGCYFVIQDRTEEVNALKREIYLANHDSLTGVYSKGYFNKKSEEYIKENPDEELLMICTDIKDFKLINDIFGSRTGDRVLINIAKMIRNRIKGAIVYGRLGNDIFGILMKKKDYSEEIFHYETQQLFANCTEEDVTFPLVNYIGVYEIKERELPVSVMCDRARMAINSIKGEHQKKMAYYDEALRDNILREQELNSDLKDAIEENQLKMFLQPQMDGDGKMQGAEALIRWHHPQKGMISPGEFIPVFEKNGLITNVDRYIWEMACKQLRKWRDAGRDDIYISVNISPKDFYLLDLYQIFTELIEKYEIDPRNLKLEITETAVMMDFKRQLELITRLREANFSVEMDDFGSGYSSLNMLKDIQVDVLKIDMAFLRKDKDTERSKAILKTVINLSKELGIPIIMEGVETKEQVEFLKEMGCNVFQGYYFARPMEVEQFEELYL